MLFGKANANSWNNRRMHTKKIFKTLRRNLSSLLINFKKEEAMIKTNLKTESRLSWKSWTWNSKLNSKKPKTCTVQLKMNSKTRLNNLRNKTRHLMKDYSLRQEANLVSMVVLRRKWLNLLTLREDLNKNLRILKLIETLSCLTTKSRLKKRKKSGNKKFRKLMQRPKTLKPEDQISFLNSKKSVLDGVLKKITS